MPAKAAPREAADWKLLDEILNEQRPRLLELARKRLPPSLRGRVEPEDILSDLPLRARRWWESFQERSPDPDEKPCLCDGWLDRLVMNCIIDAYRHHTASKRDVRRDVPLPDGSGSQLLLGIVSPGTSPSDAFARAEMKKRLEQVIAMLKESDRELLELRFYEECSSAEIADLLGLKENNVNQKLFRVVKRLKNLWKELYGLDESRP